MNFKTLLGGAALLAGMAFAVPASAHQGFTLNVVNLRSGPGVSYPVINRVVGDEPLEIYGCLDGYGWCEAGWGDARGWVSGDYVYVPYRERRVRVVEAGPALSIPLINFSLFNVEERHYRPAPPPPPHYYAPRPVVVNNYYEDDDHHGPGHGKGHYKHYRGYDKHGRWRD